MTTFDDLSTAGQAKVLHDAPDLGANITGGDAEPIGDRRIRQAIHVQDQDLVLEWGESRRIHGLF